MSEFARGMLADNAPVKIEGGWTVPFAVAKLLQDRAATIARLEADAAAWKGIHEGAVAAMQAKIDKLEAALRFYADKSNWITPLGPPPVLVDGGKRARDVLSPLTQEKTDV
jgi:hypothetical protein